MKSNGKQRRKNNIGISLNIRLLMSVFMVSFTVHVEAPSIIVISMVYWFINHTSSKTNCSEWKWGKNPFLSGGNLKTASRSVNPNIEIYKNKETLSTLWLRLFGTFFSDGGGSEAFFRFSTYPSSSPRALWIHPSLAIPLICKWFSLIPRCCNGFRFCLHTDQTCVLCIHSNSLWKSRLNECKS